MVTAVVVPLTKFFTVLDCIRYAILGEWFSSQKTIRGRYKDLDDIMTFDLTISHLMSSLVFSSVHNSRYPFKVLSCSHALFFSSVILNVYSHLVLSHILIAYSYLTHSVSYSHRIFPSYIISHIPI